MKLFIIFDCIVGVCDDWYRSASAKIEEIKPRLYLKAASNLFIFPFFNRSVSQMSAKMEKCQL